MNDYIPDASESFAMSNEDIAKAESNAFSNNGYLQKADDLQQRLLISSEKTVLGTLIVINGDVNLPVALAQLIRNAPDSFSDQRHKQISSVISSLRNSGKPVYPQAVIERCEFADAPAYISAAVNAALSLDLANREAEPIWKAYRDRRTASVFSAALDSVANNPELVSSVASTVQKALTQLADESVKDDLPEIQDAAAMLAFEPVLPDLLVQGILHQGSKLSLGGSSKAFKSWTLINLAASIATGADFLGLPTIRGRVLYINFEIDSRFMHQRTNTLLMSRLLFPEPGWLDVWNLRGKSAPYSVIIPKIIKRARDKGYALVIIDPSYKLFDAGADENSAVDVANVMNAFDSISTQTGAAVAFGAHFAKGNAAGKEAIDRVSGSGVFARDPDSLLTFTKHKEEDCFTVEASLRNLPPLKPFVVRWEYPRFERAEEMNPDDLKQSTGRPSLYSPDDLINILKEPLTTGEWQKAALKDVGISRTQFFEFKKQLVSNKLVFEDNQSRWIAALRVGE